jgi:uracil phosphoribosyltransferase
MNKDETILFEQELAETLSDLMKRKEIVIGKKLAAQNEIRQIEQRVLDVKVTTGIIRARVEAIA